METVEEKMEDAGVEEVVVEEVEQAESIEEHIPGIRVFCQNDFVFEWL